MKKLLVLVLVASLTALANGSMVPLQISVNGSPAPADSQITLAPSLTIALDIYTDVAFQPGQTTFWGLLVLPANGDISGGVVHIPPAPDMSMMLGQENADFFHGAGIEGEGIYGSVDSWASNGTAGVFYDEIVFHCNGLNDAVIQLWAHPGDYASFEMLDQIIIHQPEPATVALLSLGGLLLRKKR